MENFEQERVNYLNKPRHQTKVVLDTTRKSQRAKKTPGQYETKKNNVSEESTQKRLIKNPIRQNIVTDFSCDHCGSRYVINPMKRGNKLSTTKYKAAPRHKLDPDTQKVLSLCNACGLKFNRKRKERQNKNGLTEQERKRFLDEGETFAKELAIKLSNESACRLYCSNAKKTACGCIQKFICGTENASVEDILGRANLLLDIVLTAVGLRKLKCYDPNSLQQRNGKKKTPKIGLGNGHRKSKEFEDYVLTKREFLKNTMKLCEKGTQKILSYSNNFLHKRMKTDPEKGIRIERQKGKAALGMLKPISELPLEPCCVDNCVTMALTHSRLLESWRIRSISSQVEARRVLAEMLTPSGGNRANCYKFITQVTGCSNTTIGKVNEQMRSTGGDREPPEHGLKKYWKEKPKPSVEANFIPSYQILETAASSAGLSSVMQNIEDPVPAKKPKRQHGKTEKKKKEGANNRFFTILTESGEQTSTMNNMQALQTTVLTLNGNNQYGGFISIPSGLPSSTGSVNLPNSVSLLQQQLQQQQQLQLQIQLLQQQLSSTQSAVLTQNTSNTGDFIVSTPLEQESPVPLVVQAVSTQPQAVSLGANLVNNVSVATALVGNSNINFVTSTPMRSNQRPTTNVSLLSQPLNANAELNLITQNSTLIAQQTSLSDSNIIGHRGNREGFRQVHLITSQSPTMALNQQPVTISLQSAEVSNLPTMLLTQSSNHTPGQLVIQQASTFQQPSGLVLHPPLSVQANSDQLLITTQTVPTDGIPTSALPPITSFNADAFLTGAGTATFAVVSNDNLSQIQPPEIID